MNTDIFSILLNWTPAFASGFGLNILISLVAMAMGTMIGWGLACGRNSQRKKLANSCTLATGVFRNIPSFVFMFYVAFIIPVEFDWNGEPLRFPSWIKASIALTVPVIGFASDQFLRLMREFKKQNTIALPMFLVSWTQYFLIIIMASSTASVIGVNEIVGRANTAIAITQDPSMMLWIYMYVALWFLLSATFINILLKKISHYLNTEKSVSEADKTRQK